MKPIIAAAAAAFLIGAPAAFAQDSDQNAQTMQAVSADEFVSTAGSSNRFEIESSRLALERDVSGEVQDFAQRMIDDHTKAGEDMKAALEQTDMTSATGEPELMDKHQQMLDELEGAEGDAFQQTYVDMQVQAHDEAVQLFSSYAENGEQEALKQFAADTLPTLEEHQDMIKDIAGGQQN